MNPLVRIVYALQGHRGRQETIRKARTRYGSSAVPFLISALRDKHTDVVRVAITELAATRSPEAAEPLIALLQTKTYDSETGLHVIDALAELGDPRAIPELSKNIMQLLKWDLEAYEEAFRHSFKVYGGAYGRALRCRCEALGQLGIMGYQPLSLVFNHSLGQSCPWMEARSGGGYQLENLIDSMLQADAQSTLRECLAALCSSQTDSYTKGRIIVRLGQNGDAAIGTALKKLWVDTIQQEGWALSLSVPLCEKLKESVYKLCPNDAVEVTDAVRDGSLYAELALSENDIERFIINGDRWAIKHFGSTKNRFAGTVLLRMFSAIAETKSTFTKALFESPREIGICRDILPALANIGDDNATKVVAALVQPHSAVQLYWRVLLDHDESCLRKLVDNALIAGSREGWDRLKHLICFEGLLFSRPECLSITDLEGLARVPDDYYVRDDGSFRTKMVLSYEPLRIVARRYLKGSESVNQHLRTTEPLENAPARLYENISS